MKDWRIKLDFTMTVALALTATVVLCSCRTGRAAEAEPIVPTYQPTTSATTEETAEAITEPTATEQPITEATEPPETEPQVVLYDVPLDEGLQLYVIEQAESHGIDPAVVFAMIWKESRFHAGAVGDNGNSLGLMQIQPKWHQNRMDALGCPDLFDPFQNVTVGIQILADHVDYYEGNVEMALVAYNAGRSGANKHWFSQGEYSSKYSMAVMEKAEELRGEAYVLQ